MKIEKITITSEDLELIHEALAEYEQSFRDYQDDYPEDMTDDELDRLIRRVRDVDSAIFDLEENTPVIVEVKPL